MKAEAREAMFERLRARNPKPTTELEYRNAFELLIAVILSAVLGTYALTASKARLLFRSERAVRLLNRATGTVMAGAAVAIVSR